MKITIIVILVLLVAGSVYLMTNHRRSNDQTYNWNLELTKPLNYDANIRQLSYYNEGKEIYRNSTLNSFSGWSGMVHGAVLHGEEEEVLPDSVHLTWVETDSELVYSVGFPFPREKVLDYWTRNYDLQKEKWGSDHPQGALSLKLGLAPSGLVSLWFSDLDINASGIAIEVATYTAFADKLRVGQKDLSVPSDALALRRFGLPHFYTFEEEDVVAISIQYQNGEGNTINLKNESDIILREVNSTRGYSLAKEIIVHWFDKEGRGYKSIYELDQEEIALEELLVKTVSTNIVYLLDRRKANDGPWKQFSDRHVFELKEKTRKVNK